jgi:ketosteroid isomerase-like protein
MSEANIEVVRRAISAYNRRDFETLSAVNQADVEIDWSASRGPAAGVYRGNEAAIGFYRDFLGAFDEVTIVPESFIEAGDAVVVPNCTEVRGRDGIAAVARSALIFEVRDGRLARIRLYQEADEALEAAGLRG